MQLNKLQYSDKPIDQKFAQYVDILVNLRNEENHQAKSLDAKEVQLDSCCDHYVYVCDI